MRAALRESESREAELNARLAAERHETEQLVASMRAALRRGETRETELFARLASDQREAVRVMVSLRSALDEVRVARDAAVAEAARWRPIAVGSGAALLMGLASAMFAKTTAPGAPTASGSNSAPSIADVRQNPPVAAGWLRSGGAFRVVRSVLARPYRPTAGWDEPAHDGRLAPTCAAS